MTWNYSDRDIQRKISKLKRDQYSDGFYKTLIVLKSKVASEVSGYFNFGATNTFQIDTVNGIVEYGPELVSLDNVVQTIDGDIRLTVRATDASKIDNATEIWCGCTISNTIVSYISGTRYFIKSKQPDMFDLDTIYVMTVAGKY